MIAKVKAWAKRHPAWSTLIAVLVPESRPDVAGDSASSIRERIASHRDWDEKLSPEELDQLPGFIAKYASRGADRQAPSDPWLTVWRQRLRFLPHACSRLERRRLAALSTPSRPTCCCRFQATSKSSEEDRLAAGADECR
jgi:hypothetical protein